MARDAGINDIGGESRSSGLFDDSSDSADFGGDDSGDVGGGDFGGSDSA
jgi:hypothetical protein